MEGLLGSRSEEASGSESLGIGEGAFLDFLAALVAAAFLEAVGLETGRGGLKALGFWEGPALPFGGMVLTVVRLLKSLYGDICYIGC